MTTDETTTTTRPTTIDVAARLEYEVAAPTTFLFCVQAARTDAQDVVAERLELEPQRQHEALRYGEDGHELVRVTAEPGALELRYDATVTVARPVPMRDDLPEVGFDELPSETLPFVNPSRFCASDRLVELSTRLFGELPAGYRRVRAINDWVRDNVTYLPGYTDATTTAADVLVGRAGVCRDFAHVAIAMCRAIGIPARYVAGYGLGVDPPDFHGFMEAFIGDDWFLFDPTGMSTPGGLVRIAVGRDAADVAFATFVGQATLRSKTVTVSGTPAGSTPGTVDAAAG